MHIIEFFIESHWAIERPKLFFYLNGLKLENGYCSLHKKESNTTECLIYKFVYPKKFDDKNYISTNLSEKTDDLITKESDHWVEIKNIMINGIAADWLLYTNTKFRHNMSSEWVENMRKNGVEIPSVYSPGTEMRLNGNSEFYFEHPFWLFKVKKIEKQ